MGYIIRKRKGNAWAAVHRHDNGKNVSSRVVEKNSPEFFELGLNSSMNRDEAKAALQRTRADRKLQEELARRRKIEEKIQERELINSTWLPPTLVQEFEQLILPVHGIRRDRWLITKELISMVKTPPELWQHRPEEFYIQFKLRGDSLDYVRRLLRVINKWGGFYCLKTGKSFVEIPAPRGKFKSDIKKAFYTLKKPTGTKAFFVDYLEKARTVLPKTQLSSLKVMLYFGLRPEELRQLIDNPQNKDIRTGWWVQHDDPRGFTVLHIFQDKLFRRGTEPELCWKAIPIIENEQKELLSAIEESNLTKISKKHISTIKERIGVPISERSCRKGFVALMQLRGYSEGCHERWLGHIGNSTLRRHYETKKIAYYETPKTAEVLPFKTRNKK